MVHQMNQQSLTFYNKLVHDRIPELILAEGRKCATEILNDVDYRQALLAKLVEEAQETAKSTPTELIKELGDLFEVIDALFMAFNLDKDAVIAVQKKRRDERGGFEQRIKLLWTAIDKT